MEDLTKQQIVLVTLLVSFVTSIATGIVTVSLMQQAPGQATQTINQIVERTIERVVPAPSTQQATVIKETIVVSIEDQAVKAVEKTTPSIVRVHSVDVPKETIALGVIVSKGGLVVTDKQNVRPIGKYSATMSDGTEVSLQFVNKESAYGTLWQLVAPKDSKISFVPVNIGDSDNLKLGQSVIALYGRENLKVSLGNVQGLDSDLVATSSPSSATSTPVKQSVYTRINTNVPATVSGSPLLNLSGEVVGIKVGETGGGFVPINSFSALL